MDARQAEAVINAIMEPDLHAQREREQKRQAWKRALARRRRMAGIALVGFAAGAGLAPLAGGPVIQSAIWGSLAGAWLGWMVAPLGRRIRRRAARRCA